MLMSQRQWVQNHIVQQQLADLIREESKNRARVDALIKGSTARNRLIRHSRGP